MLICVTYPVRACVVTYLPSPGSSGRSEDGGAGDGGGGSALLRVAAAVQDSCDTIIRIRMRPPPAGPARTVNDEL